MKPKILLFDIETMANEGYVWGIWEQNVIAIKRPWYMLSFAYKWLGDKISIRGVHTWIERQKGKPQVCEHCGATRKEKWLHWSNIDHKYRRNLDDYISLCVPCHIKYDVKYNNRKFRRKNKIKK